MSAYGGRVGRPSSTGALDLQQWPLPARSGSSVGPYGSM
jgi:hypothetical protein